jgi:hypothetical protein
VDQRFWEGRLRRVHTDTIEGDKGVIGAAERAIGNSEASAANTAVYAKAAKERVERIERGETVKGGLGKPLTRKEAEAIMMQAGMTRADIRRYNDDWSQASMPRRRVEHGLHSALPRTLRSTRCGARFWRGPPTPRLVRLPGDEPTVFSLVRRSFRGELEARLAERAGQWPLFADTVEKVEFSIPIRILVAMDRLWRFIQGDIRYSSIGLSDQPRRLARPSSTLDPRCGTNSRISGLIVFRFFNNICAFRP